MKVEDFLNVHLMRSILNDLMKRTWSFKCFRVNLCYCSSVKYGLSGLQLGLTQSGGRLKSLEYLDVWWEQTHRSRTQSVSPLDGHPWVKCSSVRITTYQRGEWRRPCNFAVVLFECSETQNLGVLLTFWELPCRASPEEDFQPQQKKKKDAFRVWAGLWGGVTSHLVEWASPWHPLESKHKLRSSDFTCRSSVQPILTQCTTTNTILRGKLHWEWKNTPRDTFQIYKTFHNNLQKLYWNTRWFKTIMICVCFIFLWFVFDFRN